MGESHHAIRMMGEYTTGKRLHKCYSFEMLGDRFDPAHFRGQIEEFYAGAPGGWPTWAFSNHDVPRHVTRWAKHGIGREPLAKLAGALLLSLEGSICIYQGEELGQTETELELLRADRPAGHPLLAGADRPRRLPHADGLGRQPAERRLHRRPAVAAGQGGAGGERRRRPARPARTRCSSSTAAMLAAPPRHAGAALRAHRASSTSRSRSSPSPAAARVLCIFNLSPGDAPGPR